MLCMGQGDVPADADFSYPCRRRPCRDKHVGGNESDTHYYSVYPGHPSAPDFVKMYKMDNTIFRLDLPDMYSPAAGIKVK